MVNAKKQELIEELKALRIEKGYTYQQIADETELRGCPVSLSTVKLVFSNKRNHNHDYANILKPIADVLSSPAEDDALELKTLQTRLELKDEVIKQYESRLEKKELKHKDRERFLMDLINDLRKDINDLREEIKFKNEQIRHHNEAMDRKDKALKELYDKLLDAKGV